MMLHLQDGVWATLTAKLSRLPHALLLHGPRGVGKRLLAEQFAKLVLCERRLRTEPCGKCESCSWFEAGTHPDLRRIEPEALERQHDRSSDESEADPPQAQKKPSTEIKIEQVRALQDFVYLGSHRGNRRVVVVHPADDMNVHAANALLKSLEEPPAAALFLLVSNRPWRLLPTVRSRCVPIPVRPPDRRASAEWLKSQGMREPERWLAYWNGAPLSALEAVTGGLSEQIDVQLRLLAQGNLAGAGAAVRKEHLEAFVDLLQKFALDKVFSAFGGTAKYGTGSAKGAPPEARVWLSYARNLCRMRPLCRHPLNPALFASELISGFPGGDQEPAK